MFEFKGGTVSGRSGFLHVAGDVACRPNLKECVPAVQKCPMRTACPQVIVKPSASVECLSLIGGRVWGRKWIALISPGRD